MNNKKIITAGLIATLLLSSCGTKTIIKEVTASTTTTEVVINKYDEYYNKVLSVSSEANTLSKAFVIEFGTLICGALRNNYSMAEVSRAAGEGMNTSAEIEFAAAGMYHAIYILCPEYVNDLRIYLSQVN